MYLFVIALIIGLRGNYALGQGLPSAILGSDNPTTTLFINDAILAYRLQDPNVTLSMQTGSSSFNQNLLFTNSVDFAVTSMPLTPKRNYIPRCLLFHSSPPPLYPYIV